MIGGSHYIFILCVGFVREREGGGGGVKPLNSSNHYPQPYDEGNTSLVWVG